MFFDAAGFDSEDEEEIMEEFMMAHSEQVHRSHMQCFAELSRNQILYFQMLSGREEKMEMHSGRKRVFNPEHNASTFPEKV